MATVGISSEIIPNWTDTRPVQLWVWLEQPFIAADGTPLQSAAPGNDNVAIRKVTCTVDSGAKTLTIPAISDLYSTTDGLDIETARYSASFFLANGTPVKSYQSFESFRLPPAASQTWEGIRTYNFHKVSAFSFSAYTKDESDRRYLQAEAAGITSLNTLTTLTQVFATGTSGSDFDIASSGSIHTFNLPTASAANRGALSAADWSTFNSKQAAGSYITGLTGDVTASGPGSVAAAIANNAVTDGKLRDSAALTVIGRSVNSGGDPADIAASVDGQVLRRSGTSLGFGLLADVNVDASAAIAQSKVANLTSDLSARTLAATTITVAGTANQITSSAGAQDLSANRTWTLSIPNSFTLPGASPVFTQVTARLLDKGGMVYDLAAFGADMTGATDSNTAISDAIAALPAQGGTIYVPEGILQYSATPSSLAGKYVVIKGAGNGATIFRWSGANNGVMIDTVDMNPGSRIENIRFIKSAAQSGVVGVRMGGTLEWGDINVYNCSFNSIDTGIDGGSTRGGSGFPQFDSSVSYCEFVACSVGWKIYGSGNDGPFNAFRLCTTAGVQMFDNPNAAVNGGGVELWGCTFAANALDINIQSNIVTLTVQNCHFETSTNGILTASASAAAQGITFDSSTLSTASGSNLLNFTNITGSLWITNNVIDSGGGSTTITIPAAIKLTQLDNRLTDGTALGNIEEQSSYTYGDASTVTVTFNAGATDPTWTYISGQVTLSNAFFVFQSSQSGSSLIVEDYLTGASPLPSVILRGARGTVGSPTQLLTNDLLGAIIARGYHSGGAFGTANVAAIRFEAVEDFTATAQGTRVTIGTTPATTAARITRLIVESDGALSLQPRSATAGQAGELRLLELAANGVSYTGWKSPDALAGNIVYTLPNADGSVNQVLKTDGAGTLSWANNLSGGAPVDATYLLLTTNLGLANSRVLTGAANEIELVDGGAGGSLTIGIPSIAAIATSLTVPTFYGGSAAGSTIRIEGTSNGSPSAADIYLNGAAGFASSSATGRVIIGGLTGGSYRLDIQSTDTAQLRICNTNAVAGAGSAGIQAGVITLPNAADQRVAFYGFGAASGVTSSLVNGAMIAGYSDEAWVVGTNQGMYLRFETTPVGSVTRAERMRILGTGNVKIAGTAVRGTTEGTNHLDIFDGTAPVGTLANGISLYSTAGELRVMDAAGNATLLSPHDKEGRWIHDEVNYKGRRLRIDLERMLKFLNDHFGTDFIREYAVS